MTHIEKMKYINSRNQEIEFGINGLYMDEVALSWKHEPKSENNVIISYSAGITSFSLPALIIADTDEQANEIRDRLHDVLIYDILKEEKGRLIYRGYTLYCNINESTNSNYQEWTAFGDVSLTVTTDKPFWIKESTVTLIAADAGDEISGAFDYPYDYNHDFGLISNKLIFENKTLIDSDFIMKIQGEVSTPTVYINGHMYSVDVVLSKGDTLIINSSDKTISLISSSGASINCLDLRNRDSFVFEKIAAGRVNMYTPQALSIELTLFDERGEPRWS